MEAFVTPPITYDLMVIGAGPAGCAAAITAARNGARVLLLEKGHYPRHKVCGEYISAESVGLLETLLTAAGSGLIEAAPRIHFARLCRQSVHATVPLDRPGISLTRYALDSALFEAARYCGVTALQRITVNSIHARENVFVAATTLGDFAAQTVIVAAGRWSTLRHSAPNPDAECLGIKAHFSIGDATAQEDLRGVVELHFFGGGYCGVQLITDGIASACAMVRPGVARSFEDVFQQADSLAARTRTWHSLFTPITTYPLAFCQPQCEKDGILYAGDAAAFVDPFTGDGISLALNTGAAASRALAPVWRGEIQLSEAAAGYRAEYKCRFGHVFRNAERIRKLFALPNSFQIAAAHLLRIPVISKQFVRLTRAA